jgi:sterol desaturase/sphingolipid hydroxylase (fatty acid hydroxylase superfamily)
METFHIRPIATEILRLCVWLLLLMMVFVPLERLFGVRPQRVFRRAFRVDLGYYFLTSLAPKFLLVLPMAFVAWGLRRLVPAQLHAYTAGMPLWARLASALLVGELGFYWGHRWAHQIPLLWRFHSVHHSAEEMDWLVNTRAHPLDVVFVRLCGLVPMYALGLAQPARGATLDVTPLLVLLLATLWGFFVHANLRWRFGWLGVVVSTPAFHHWHHTRRDHVDRNYASMIPCLDRIFGTWYMPDGQWPVEYGTETIDVASEAPVCVPSAQRS